jgi:hypothetical protein
MQPRSCTCPTLTLSSGIFVPTPVYATMSESQLILKFCWYLPRPTQTNMATQRHVATQRLKIVCLLDSEQEHHIDRIVLHPGYSERHWWGDWHLLAVWQQMRAVLISENDTRWPIHINQHRNKLGACVRDVYVFCSMSRGKSSFVYRG